MSIKQKCIFLLITIFYATEKENSKPIVDEFNKIQETIPILLNALKEASKEESIDYLEHVCK